MDFPTLKYCLTFTSITFYETTAGGQKFGFKSSGVSFTYIYIYIYTLRLG